MATLAERKIAAIVAAVCADAAAQPIHMVFVQQKLDDALSGKENIEFIEPSINPFYRIENGKNSSYGDQAFVLLESLVANKGLNEADLVDRYYKHFGPDSEYDVKRNRGLPQKQPYRNGSLANFIKNIEAKEKGTESAVDKVPAMDAIVKLPPIVALYAGRADLLEKVEDAIRVTQDHDLNVAVALVAARILEKAILYGKEKSLREITEEVLAKLRDPKNPDRHELDTKMATIVKETLDATVHSHKEVTQTMFEKSAELPKAFQSALHGVLTAPDGGKEEERMVEGVRATLCAGGCNASRANFIAACHAAQLGMASIPAEWCKKTLCFTRLQDLAQNLSEITPQ